MRGLFITGTDTGVGKTVVSVAWLHALRASGTSAVGMKPVASGCRATALGWRNDDALALQAASDGAPDYAWVNPFALPEATAPQIAARNAGVEVSLPVIETAYAHLAANAEVVVVEGVGGWLAPLADRLEQAELVGTLGLDVILVVGLRLGCLNHARLSERAIRADGLRLRGWVANAVVSDLAYADDYVRLLEQALSSPCLGRLPFDPQGDPADRARHARKEL